ncbi:hypothetical protein RHGRI_002240 [Rhododendron griersonianum]|uniref:Retrovirus-related Pol polyprotein from transposon TNT 1-94-like beta-barrel domain-containing protein n=1 Tax=Rhododendron griersonianum TaxID=479676 RepID=A0AAV6LPD4_9ERIC|nr:hypothetical protein RHGRI_002240 [Rhododendron griersonianum]
MGGQSENNSAPRLSSVLLNGLNYVPWSRVVALALGGKSLYGHIDGTKTPPIVSKPPKTNEVEKYGEWKSENQYTMSLLLNSMEPKVSEIFTFADSAQDLWTSVKDLYGHQHNAARIYQLQQAINNCEQGDRSFVEYFGELKSMWDELGLYRPPVTDLVTLQQRAEQDKVFQLLAHIKPDFENLRSQILMGSNNGTPSLSSVCASIQQEETRRKAMNIEPKSTIIHPEASALMVDKRKVDTRKQSGNLSLNKGHHCDHCDKDGHSKDRCWILFPHLKPKFKRGEKMDTAANSVTSEASDLVGQLSKLLQQYNKTGSSIETSSSTHVSGNLKAFLSSSSNNCTWIMDSGATDHITNDCGSLCEFTPETNNSVSVANGSSIPIHGCGKLKFFF